MKATILSAFLLLAVAFSSAGLADDKQQDFNRQLQQQVQALSQFVINTRMKQAMNTPKISLSEFAPSSKVPLKAKLNGATRVLSTLTMEINE